MFIIMNFRLFFLALVLVSSNCHSLDGLPEGAMLVFKMDYEDGQVASSARVAVNRPKAPEALRVDCRTDTAKHCSLVSKVAPLTSYVSAGAYRAESDTMSFKQSLYKTGDEFLYRFSFALASDWEYDSTSAIDAIWQFKRFNGPPDAFFAIKGKALVLRVGANSQLTLLPIVPLNQWIDLEIHARWSKTDDGFFSGYIKSVQSGEIKPFAYHGPTMSAANSNVGYLKWGLYKPGPIDGSFTFHQREIFHDDISVYRY